MRSIRQFRLIATMAACCSLFANASYASNTCNVDTDAYTLKNPARHSSFLNTPEAPILWTQAHLLRGLAAVHQGNENEETLIKLKDGIDYILSNTSEKLGLSDTLRDGPQPAWGSTIYSCGNYTVSLVHTAVLSYPISYFAKVVLSNPERYSEYTSAARDFLRAAESAVEIHSNQFQLVQGDWVYRQRPNVSELGSCTNSSGSEVDFTDQNNAVLPYNMMLSMGLTHLELSRVYSLPGVTQNISRANYHRDRAVKLAQTFKNALVYIPQTDSYQWDYLLDGRSEDIAHAALDIPFVMEVFREGIVFNNEDIKRFVNTFLLATENRNHIFSHVDKTADDKGVRDSRWQIGIVGWAELSLVDPRVAERAREIFYRFGGGYQPTGSGTWYGEALLLKWQDPNTRFPVLGTSHSDLPSFRPDYALRTRNIAGLFRTPSMTHQVIDGADVTSCAEFEFHNEQHDDLSINYAHTKQTSNVDGCLGAGCDTPSGFHVFFANDTNAAWQYGGSMSQIDSEVYHTESISSPIDGYDKVLACRSASGHARDNISIRQLGIDTSSCELGYEQDESSFSSMDGWNVGDQTNEAANLPKYIYRHNAGDSGRSNGFLEVLEPSNISTRVDPSSNDATLGNLDFGFHKQFVNNSNGFSVSGWTRVSSRYSGTGNVNNRCVMALNADTGQTLRSYCMNWKNVDDTGWRYFDVDFTPYVDGVQNVKVVIGSADSWLTNWNQHLRIDDVTVKVAKP